MLLILMIQNLILAIACTSNQQPSEMSLAQKTKQAHAKESTGCEKRKHFSMSICTLGNDTFVLGDRWKPVLQPFGVQACVRCQCIEHARKECGLIVRCERFADKCPTIKACPFGEAPVKQPGQCCESCPGSLSDEPLSIDQIRTTIASSTTTAPPTSTSTTTTTTTTTTPCTQSKTVDQSLPTNNSDSNSFTIISDGLISVEGGEKSPKLGPRPFPKSPSYGLIETLFRSGRIKDFRIWMFIKSAF